MDAPPSSRTPDEEEGATPKEQEERECPVCLERFTRVIRCPVECPHCAVWVCRLCFQQLVIGSTGEPACPACKGIVPYDYFAPRMPQRCLTSPAYRANRMRILWEQAEQRLPDAQPLVRLYTMGKEMQTRIQAAERRRPHLTACMSALHAQLGAVAKARRSYDATLSKVVQEDMSPVLDSMAEVAQWSDCVRLMRRVLEEGDAEVRRLVVSLWQRGGQDVRQERLRHQLLEVERQVRGVNREVAQCSRWKRLYTAALRRGDVAWAHDADPRWRTRGGEVEEEVEAPAATAASRGWVCRCPREACLGYVLRPTFRCGICSSRICRRCRAVVSEGEEEEGEGEGEEGEGGAGAGGGGPSPASTKHVCAPSDLEAVALIRRTCKPCPACTTPIQKVSGCDQMWCTACNTAFSWTRGTILNHRHIHNPHYFQWLNQGGGGGGEGVAAGCPALFTPGALASMSAPFQEIARFCAHLEDVVIQDLGRDGEGAMRSTQAAYLAGDVAKDVFLRRLGREDKRRRVVEATIPVLQTFVEGARHFLRQYLECDVERDRYRLLAQVFRLLEYVNQLTEDVRGCQVTKAPPFITVVPRHGLGKRKDLFRLPLTMEPRSPRFRSHRTAPHWTLAECTRGWEETRKLVAGVTDDVTEDSFK